MMRCTETEIKTRPDGANRVRCVLPAGHPLPHQEKSGLTWDFEKGGGRESGGDIETPSLGEPRSQVSPSAANPAALHTDGGCPYGLMSLGAHDERIRELEARVKELEAREKARTIALRINFDDATLREEDSG